MRTRRPDERDSDTPFAAPGSEFTSRRARALVEQERSDRRNAILVWSALAFILGFLFGAVAGWPF